jgi:hypothetical protein
MLAKYEEAADVKQELEKVEKELRQYCSERTSESTR